LEKQATRLTNIAQVVSKCTNPAILSVITLLLMVFTKSTSVRESINWYAIILLFFVFIPAVYILLRTSGDRKRIKTMVELSKFLKQHPVDILGMALLLGIPCLLILWYIKAPPVLIATIAALLAGSIVTSLFNLFYKVSFHMTGFTILIIMIAREWGQPFLFLLLLIPLISWAKFYIHDHTIPQLISGILVAVAVSLGILQLNFLR